MFKARLPQRKLALKKLVTKSLRLFWDKRYLLSNRILLFIIPPKIKNISVKVLYGYIFCIIFEF